MKIGVICPSEIAYRRFMPALKGIKGAEFYGIAYSSEEERFNDRNLNEQRYRKEILQVEKEKAQKFITEYGGKLFDSYSSIINCPEIDAIYIPLPPSLHFEWAKKALENKLHVLLEKPATLSFLSTCELINLAKKSNLVLYENYMFGLHNQLSQIQEIIEDSQIGDIRLQRLSFGFPRRDKYDFRYNKSLGGGALYDAGGYVIKLADILLNNDGMLKHASLGYLRDFEVDIYGSGIMEDNKQNVVQFAFGMDNDYKCDLEIWGSNGTLRTNRILTAPAGFKPKVIISKNGEEHVIELADDDTFKKSIMNFIESIKNTNLRNQNYDTMHKQAKFVDDFMNLACKGRNKND